MDPKKGFYLVTETQRNAARIVLIFLWELYILVHFEFLVLDNDLLQVLTVYAPHSVKLEEEKESFWNKMFHLVSCIPQNEMVVLASDMNGHVGSCNVAYDGTHGGFGYGDRNADGSRTL